MKLRLDPFSPNGVSIDNSTVTVAGGSSSSGSSTPVTITGEDYLSLTAQEITANPIDLDNLSATGTPSGATFLRGDNTWATPAGSGDVSKVGTPVNNQVGVWTGDGTIEGDANLTFDTATDTLATVTVTASGAVTGSNLSGTHSGSSSGTNTGDQTSIVGITGTKAQFDTAVTDGNILFVGDVTQYTDEMAQDAVGGMVDTTLVYNDATPSLVRAALTGDVTASAGSNTTAIAAGVIVDADVNASAAIAGTKLANTPAGNIAATTVQAAINELDSEKQPLDSDLTTIAGLTATTDNIIQSVSSAWSSRTPAQVAATLAAEVGKLMYPVGSYYINETDSTNPGTLLGFGTWSAIVDKFIVAHGSTYTSTGGAATVASNVTVATQPTFTVDSHTHPLSSAGGVPFALDGTSSWVKRNGPTTSWTAQNKQSSVTWAGNSDSKTESLGLIGATDATAGTATTRTADVALTNNATSVIPPYQAAYIWKRTA